VERKGEMKHTIFVEVNGRQQALRIVLEGLAAYLGAEMTMAERLVIETDHDQLAGIIETLTAEQPTAAPIETAQTGYPTAEAFIKLAHVTQFGKALKEAAEQTEKYMPAVVAVASRASKVMPAGSKKEAKKNTCAYCGTPISAKAKMCGKPECKRKYNNEQYAKRKGKTQEAVVATYDAEGGGKAVDESPGDPFPGEVQALTPNPSPNSSLRSERYAGRGEMEWPADGSLFRVLDGKLKGTTYANWEMSEALADGDLEPGTMVEHRHQGMHQVQTTLDGPRDKYTGGGPRKNTGGGQKLRLVRMQEKESSTEPSEAVAEPSSDPIDRGAG